MHPFTVIYADLDEMVFADRERAYGAYPLRKRYRRHLTLACLLTALLFSMASLSPVFANWLGGGVSGELAKPREILLSSVILPPPVEKPREPVKLPEMPKKPEKIASTRFAIPDPTPEDELTPEEADNSIVDQSALDSAFTISHVDQIGDELFDFKGIEDGTGSIPDVIVVQEDSDPQPGDFVFVEEEPRPVNMTDLVSCIKYPSYLSQAEITGGVTVRILVDELGHYRKHIVINQAHPALAKAVEGCIDQLQFTPAIQGKQPIKFWVNVPFKFQTY